MVHKKSKAFLSALKLVFSMNKKEIKEISKKTNISEEEIEKILISVTKPSLDNIDCPHYKFGVGSSDKD